MPRLILIPGFLIIAAIVIAGCTSPPGGVSPGPGSKSPAVSSPAQGPGTQTGSLESIIQCPMPPMDPIHFQKFFPDVPGWTRQYGQNLPFGNRYMNASMRSSGVYVNSITEGYTRSDKHLTVTFIDFGPCADPSFTMNQNYVSSLLNGTQSRIANFHGYPATRVVYSRGILGTRGDLLYASGVNSRLFVNMYLYAEKEYPVSELEADMETFANAIDFNGYAMMVHSAGTELRYYPSLTVTTVPAALRSRNIAVTARYNPDGSVTVTNNGGEGTGDLSFITVSVNGAKAPGRLGPAAGSAITVPGSAGSKNHVIAVGTFRDGIQQVVLDIIVGP